jgi:hypothetical protein
MNGAEICIASTKLCPTTRTAAALRSAIGSGAPTANTA